MTLWTDKVSKGRDLARHATSHRFPETCNSWGSEFMTNFCGLFAGLVGSLLADDMGLGKTLQCAALLQYLCHEGGNKPQSMYINVACSIAATEDT